MKKHKSLLVWVLVIGIILISLTMLDFLALSDIHKDYVSKEVLESYNVEASDKLPDWSSANLEWSWIRLSFLLRLLFVGFIIVAIARIARRV